MIETIDNKGTTYTIGGDNYYGQWILPIKSDNIFTDTFGGNASKTYDISSWLPDDNYDYDVQFSGYIRTGSTSGYAATLDIITNNGNLKIARENTRSSSNHIGAGGGILRIPADNRIITVKNYASQTTGSCGASISMIRRVGKQAELTSGYIDSVSITTISTTTTSFGGSNFDGSFTWLADESQVEIGGSMFTMAANSYNTFSLPFLPNDGYDYELIVSGAFTTGSKSGNIVSANIFGGTVNSTNAPNAGFRLGRQVTRTNSSESCAGSGIVVIPANDRNITVWNPDGNAKSEVCSLNANAYRRIGKNV